VACTDPPIVHDNTKGLRKRAFCVLSLLLLQQQKIAIAAAERFWAKATIYFVLSTYPRLKSGAIVLRVLMAGAIIEIAVFI
jgi:hypothetical protein